MARPKTTKEENVQTETVIVEAVQSDFAKLLETYKTQNPKKYELKKDELLKKLNNNK